MGCDRDNRHRVLVGGSRGRLVQRVHDPTVSRDGVPQTALHSARVHDALPPIPPPKKKEKEKNHSNLER